jgi:hypothetical protein
VLDPNKVKRMGDALGAAACDRLTTLKLPSTNARVTKIRHFLRTIAVWMEEFINAKGTEFSTKGLRADLMFAIKN